MAVVAAELGYMTPLPPKDSAAAARLPIAKPGEDGLSASDGTGELVWTFDHRGAGESRDARNSRIDEDGRAAAALRAEGGEPAWCLRDFRRVAVNDGRQHDSRHFRLDHHGFALVHEESEFAQRGGDFYTPSVVEESYYPEVEAVLRAKAGVDRVLVFDHITRDVAPPASTASAKDPRGYVTHVHCDYTELGAHRRAEQLLGPVVAEEWCSNGRRLGIVQLWRPIAAVQQSPLALLDASTVNEAERIQIQLQYEARVGLNYYLAHSDTHKWWYFPTMTPDECLLFKCFDSDDSRAQFCFHTSFDLAADTAEPASVPHRKSIEVRALVSWPAELNLRVHDEPAAPSATSAPRL